VNYLQNHIWCSDSNWGGGFNCRHLVSIESYKSGKNDWKNITDIKKVFVQSEYDEWKKQEETEEESEDKKRFYTEERLIRLSTKNVIVLKKDVMDWLQNNISDEKNGAKGWCVGSENYNAGESGISFKVFFKRKSDAMKFIKQWSEWKKPVFYCQYFTDVRKELDLKTLKYKK